MGGPFPHSVLIEYKFPTSRNAGTFVESYASAEPIIWYAWRG